MVGVDDAGYCIFDSDFHGLRACALDLHTKWSRDGLKTIEAIVRVYAPAADHNDVVAYEQALSDALGIDKAAPLDLSIANILAQLVRAVVMHENGQVPYGAAEFLGAAQAALSSGE